MRLITHGFLDVADAPARPADTARRRPGLIILTWLGALLIACPAFPGGMLFLPYFPVGLAQAIPNLLSRWFPRAAAFSLTPVLSIGGLWLGYAVYTGAVLARVRSRRFWLLYAILAFVLITNAVGCRFDMGQP